MQTPDLAEALDAAAPIPVLCLHTDKLPAAEASEQWCQLMAPLFHIEKAPRADGPPRGSLSLFVVGEIMVSRNTFNAQRLWRDTALIAKTPDHLVLHYYRSGGFRGMIAGKPVWITRGKVAVGDLSQEMDAITARSDTIGLSVPRSLLTGIDQAALREQLDTARNRRLGAFMATLPRRLGSMCVGDIPKLTAEIAEVLHRIFGSGSLQEDAEPPGADELLSCAMRTIEMELATPDLSPTVLANLLHTSRSSLYRLFVPIGGIMRYVQERRLHAACSCLTDVLDERPLYEIAAANGFGSQAHFSRAFHGRFGVAPGAWRQLRRGPHDPLQQLTVEPIHGMWRDLGRSLSFDDRAVTIGT